LNYTTPEDEDSCIPEDRVDAMEKAYDKDSEYFFEHFAMETSVITDNNALYMVGIKVYTFFMVGLPLLSFCQCP